MKHWRLILLFLMACDQETYLSTSSVTSEIGADGGSVSLPGVELTIPQGAFQRPVRITITRTDSSAPPGFVGYSPVFRFEPAGLEISPPATVRIETTRAAPTNTQLIWTLRESDGWADIGGTHADGVVTAQVEHFSWGFAGTRAVIRDGGTDGDIETDMDVGVAERDADVDTDVDADIDANMDVDAGIGDAGPTDAARVDAASDISDTDSGTPRDSGTQDLTDAPLTDSGTRLDAGFSSGCGADGEDCCSTGAQCADGLVCAVAGPDTYTCQSCGGNAQPCCPDRACDRGLECHGMLMRYECLPCGASGWPCCTSGDPCEAGLTCEAVFGSFPFECR